MTQDSNQDILVITADAAIYKIVIVDISFHQPDLLGNIWSHCLGGMSIDGHCGMHWNTDSRLWPKEVSIHQSQLTKCCPGEEVTRRMCKPLSL